MSNAARPFDPSPVAARHARGLMTLAKRWGVAEQVLLAGSGLAAESLTDPETLPLATLVSLVERARTLTREEALGWHLGMEAPLVTPLHASVDLASMNARALAATAEAAVDHAGLRNGPFTATLEIDGADLAVVLRERADLGSARDVFLVSTLLGLWHFWRARARELGRECRIEMTIDEPSYYERLRTFSPTLHFGQSHNRLLFRGALDASRSFSGDDAQARAPFGPRDGRRELGAGPHLLERVRNLLPESEDRFRSFHEVAVRLGMSTRTLRRRLEAEGTSFSALLMEARQQRSLTLLGVESLSVREIAQRLGYSSVSNFIRAFRLWTGRTPRAFRHQGGVSGSPLVARPRT